MSIASRLNRWWWDVLKHGLASRYFKYFDLEPREPLLLPVLGDHYGRELEAGRIGLAVEDGEPVVTYHANRFPIAPGSLAGEDLVAVAKDPGRLHGLLERQHYRLALWRMAGRELPYRRFFDVNSLIALRQELPEVFADTHRLILEWIRSGDVDGLRIDHVDGLRDPEGYLRRLRAAAPAAWIVVEKILSAGEQPPAGWPVAGTTGYEFLNLLGGLYVDPTGELVMTAFYELFSGEMREFDEIVHESRRLVLRALLWSDLDRLAAVFAEVCAGTPRFRDFTRWEMEESLAEVIACLRVYRTYIRPGEPLREADRREIGRAVDEAKRRRPDLDPELLDFLRDVLLRRADVETLAQEELIGRFQQTSSPVAAKGVEDTALYRYNRLVCLNEVGGDAGRWGSDPAAFHDFCQEAAHERPAAMLTTSTHDSKRSEDVRARIALLSEMPEVWEAAVRRWSEMNERHRRGDRPDRNLEYLYYQTLVGAHPLSSERATAYMEKAAHEAKEHTSWIRPDAAYDAALREFVLGTLEDEEFTADVADFVAPLVEPGRVNSLSQKLICLTAPGVPDLYRGSEVWDLSLVDPDNRRPVGLETLARLLEQAEVVPAGRAWRESAASGLPKLLLVRRALAARRRLPEAFAPGAAYRPLPASGQRAAHLVAFLRGERALTLAPRLVLGLRGGWGDTVIQLPPGRWRGELGAGCWEGEVSVAELLSDFPVQLLVRD